MKLFTASVYVILALLLVPFASAYADITFDFNVDDVQGYAYNCLNDECSDVSSFGGSFIGGSGSDDGQVTVRFPSTLQNSGYALYFVSEGYVPLEGKFTYHTYGNNGYVSATLPASFYQLDSCQAIIDDFSLVNEVYANEPLAVNISSRADAVVASAFTEAGDVVYVPAHLKDEFYSADVSVGYEVYSDSGLVHSAEVLFTTETGNPLFQDEMGEVHFIWTPVEDGDYDVVAYTKVIDNQCSSSLEASTEKELTVLPARPTNECYTLLNGLDLLTQDAQVGKELDFSVDKISNYANNNHALSPVDTDLTISVYNNDELVYSEFVEAVANPDVYDSTEVFFSYTPATAGELQIQVGGIAQCPVAKNSDEFVSLNFNVAEKDIYDVSFIVLDDSANAVEFANVTMDGISVLTDVNGQTAISIVEGIYTYTIVADDFYSYNKTIEVDSHRSEYVTLSSVVIAQCRDGLDNDGDGLVDLNDPGCLTADDLDESDATTACQDGLDNDGDGFVDFPEDIGCEDAQDNDELNAVIDLFACEDGLDNDGDGLVDLADSGCDSLVDDSEYNDIAMDVSLDVTPISGMTPLDIEIDCSLEGGNGDVSGEISINDGADGQGFGEGDRDLTYSTTLTTGVYWVTCSFVDSEQDVASETVEVVVYGPVCEDGLDNDNDSLIDLEDPGCLAPDSDTEDNEAFDLSIDGGYLVYPAMDDSDVLVRFKTHNTLGYAVPVVTDVALNGAALNVGPFAYDDTIRDQGINLGMLSAGTYDLSFVVDSDEFHSETDENNTYTFVFTVGAQVYACSDGLDNDGDGFIDFGFDPGCDSLTDNDEAHVDGGDLFIGDVDVYVLGNFYSVGDGDTLVVDPVHSIGVYTNVENTFSYLNFDNTLVRVNGIDVEQSISADSTVEYVHSASTFLAPGDYIIDVVLNNSYDQNGVLEMGESISFMIHVNTPACSDGLDNDGDGFVDMDDVGCESLLDDDEYNAPVVLAACEDGLDNDNDSLIDLADPGCENSSDDDEYNVIIVDSPVVVNLNSTPTTGVAPLDVSSYCTISEGDSPFNVYWDVSFDSTVVYSSQKGMAASGVDVEEFTFVQPGVYEIECSTIDASQNVDSDSNTITVTELFVAECADGLDNDGDGLSDLNDPGCLNSDDDNEADGTGQCQDGLDNDGDGFVDLDDAGCLDAQDNDEMNTNDFLLIQNNPHAIAYVANPYDYTFSVLSSREPVSYSLVTGPDQMTLSSDGKIYWMPLPHDIGKHNVSVVVSNGHEERSVTWTINVISKAPESEILREKLGINRITFPEGDYVTKGNSLPITIHLDNYGDFDLEDVRVTVSNLKLGIRHRIGPFDLDEGDEMSRTVYVEVPTYAQSGWYDLRITVANDELHRVKHRDIWVE